MLTSVRLDDMMLKPLSDFKPELIARRACPDCATPLPVDIDERDVHVLAIAGLNQAGKTHFLGAAFSQAVRGRRLAAVGVSEFRPDVESAAELHQSYFAPLFHDRATLSGTIPDDNVRYRGLNFRVTMEAARPIVLMTHDVSGETIADWRRRASSAPFLARASAMIFVVDPTEFLSIRDRLLPQDRPVSRSIDQGDLLAACLQELAFEPGGQPVPVAVVLAKSDLVSQALDREFSFTRDATDASWVEDVKATSAEVRNLLVELGETALVDTAEEHGRVTFHAVSALGSSPLSDPSFSGAKPVRCLDPLVSVLLRLGSVLA